MMAMLTVCMDDVMVQYAQKEPSNGYNEQWLVLEQTKHEEPPRPRLRASSGRAWGHSLEL